MSNGFTVITVFDPRLSFRHQIRCLAAWKALGVRACMALSSEPARTARLAADGLSGDDMLPFGPDDMGADPAGVALPRLTALLTWAERTRPGPLAVIRAGIYPLARSPGVFDFWLRRADIAGLVAESCILPETVAFADTAPRRERLAAVVMSATGRRHLSERLRALPVPDDLLAGGPWWDMVAAWLLLGSAPGAPPGRPGRTIVADGSLLYQRREDDQAVGTFAVDRLISTLPPGVGGTDTAGMPNRILADIKASCSAHRTDAGRVRALEFRHPADLPPPRPAAVRIAADVFDRRPSIGWILRPEAVAALAEQDIAEGVPRFERALEFFCRNRDPQMLFQQRLETILYCQHILRESVPDRRLTPHYPTANRHRLAIETILRNCPPDKPNRRMEMARMFGAELVKQAIFNPRIFNYLLACCEMPEEVDVLRAIHATLEMESNAHVPA